jgi:hypothetical protein
VREEAHSKAHTSMCHPRSAVVGVSSPACPHLFLSSILAICTHSLGPTLLLSLLNTTYSSSSRQNLR